LRYRTWGNTKYLWGASRRERIQTAGLVLLLIGAPTLGLLAMTDYPPLQNLSLSMALAGYLPLLLASFVIVRARSFPVGTPLPIRVVARAGWALSLFGGLLGIALIANGIHTHFTARSALCVAKRMSREPDEARRAYYLTLRAWPASDRTVEVRVHRSVYARAEVGGDVVLTLGEGRLGIEWVRDVSTPH